MSAQLDGVAVLVDDQVAPPQAAGQLGGGRGPPSSHETEARLHLGRPGGVEHDVVEAPLTGDRGQSTLGGDGHQPALETAAAQQPTHRTGLDEVTPGVDQ